MQGHMTNKALLLPGRIGLTVAVAAFGAHFLLYALWPTLPVPGPPCFGAGRLICGAAGAGLLAAAVALTLPRAARATALLLSGFLLLRVLFIYVPHIVTHPRNPDAWTCGAELLCLAGGALALAGVLGRDAGREQSRRFYAACEPVGWWMFALPLVVFAAQHCIYARFVATLVPGWIPWHLFWTYFVAAAFLASTLAILCRVLFIAAGMSLAAMFLLWFFMLHLPMAFAAPRDGNLWTSAWVALAMAACSCIVAATRQTTSDRVSSAAVPRPARSRLQEIPHRHAAAPAATRE